MNDKKVNQLKMGVILSYVNLVISSLIPFFYTPIMLKILGQSEYGLFSLANSVVGYLSLLNLGFGSTIIRYIAKYRAEEDEESIKRIFGFSLTIYSIIGVVVLILGIVLSNYANNIFSQGLTQDEIVKMRMLIVLMSINMMISFPMSVFSSVIIAYERYFFKRVIDIVSTVLAPFFNLIALYLGFASVGMVIASTILQMIMIPLHAGYCFKNLHIYPSFKKLSNQLIHEMMTFSIYVFIGTIVDMLFWSTDKVILGMKAGSTAVAIYNVAVTFNNMIITMSSSISGVLTPKITSMVTKNVSKGKLTEIFIRVGRIQYIIISLIVSGYIVFGRQFLYLWAGEAYGLSYWIALLTIIPLSVPLIQNTGISILIAENKHKFRSIIYLIIALVNVVSTYLIVPYYGGIGAAFCSCISYIVGQGIIMNCYYYKVIQIDIIKFWKNIVKMSITPSIMIIISIMMRKVLVCNNWMQFFIKVIIYTGIYLLFMYKVSFNEYEKNIIIELTDKIFRKKKGN